MRRDVRQHSFTPSEPLDTPIRPVEFKEEVKAWAKRLDVNPAEVRLTNMSRKWASCSTTGRVTFANDLLAQPEEFRREVIVHELLHVKVPNHGPLFRALLSAHLGAFDSPSSEPTAGGIHRGQRP